MQYAQQPIMKPTRVSREELEVARKEEVQSVLAEQVGWKKPDHSAAFKAFDKLVGKGCDPVFLFSMLGILANAHRADTWRGLTGFADPDTLRTAVKRLRTGADDIDEILKSVIGKAILWRPSEQALPNKLRGVADVLDRTVMGERGIKPETNLTSRAARCAIVRHVQERTGRPHDSLVADILAPRLGCNVFAQAQWRRDNAHLLAAPRKTQDG